MKAPIKKNDKKDAKKVEKPSARTKNKQGFINLYPTILENVGSHAVITFGRMNPPTIGHEKVINKVLSYAKSVGGTPLIYISHSEGDAKNPIPYKLKLSVVRQIAGKSNVPQSSAKHIFDIAKELDQKYDAITLVVGSDRVDEFKTLMNKYNHKEYEFDQITIVSAGSRDPDSSDISGISGTKVRQFAIDGQYDDFKSAISKKVKAASVKQMFDQIRTFAEELSPAEAKKRDQLIQSMKKNKDRLMRQHGDDWQAVMKANATKKAAQMEQLEFDQLIEELDDVIFDLDELDEALSASQRRKRSMSMRRNKVKIQRGRKRFANRVANNSRLKGRAKRQARGAIKKKLSGGKSYSSMSTAQKISVDKRSSRRKKAIGNLAKRLMPKVRKQNLRSHYEPENEVIEEKKHHRLINDKKKVVTDKRFKIYRPKVHKNATCESVIDLVDSMLDT